MWTNIFTNSHFGDLKLTQMTKVLQIAVNMTTFCSIRAHFHVGQVHHISFADRNDWKNFPRPKITIMVSLGNKSSKNYQLYLLQKIQRVMMITMYTCYVLEVLHISETTEIQRNREVQLLNPQKDPISIAHVHVPHQIDSKLH